ncbi:uncharacterized protein BDV14DRAFT_195970 [Aspergillus stella-maris]|uniref:uncharacterized protein n=1 Tax=Aspergillus stella-maris TaxID=1810926 RepID=UPI003CCD5515
MWPVAEFYDGSNQLTTEELRLADIYRERDREDLANYVIEGRKIQRFFFALGPESSLLDAQTFGPLFKGSQRAFDLNGEEWDAWRSKALMERKSEDLLCEMLEQDSM